MYVYSQLPTAADREAYEKLKSTPPTATGHPNVFSWFVHVNRFSEAARHSWGGAAPAAPAKGGKAAPAKKEEEAKPVAKAEPVDDTDDLFGSDDEGDSVSSFSYIVYLS